MAKKLRVGFIGLGLMGSPMAKNILKAGYPLIVYNRTPAKTNELKKLGAEVGHSPAEVGARSDVVITMVTGPKDVRQVLLGRRGVSVNVDSSPIIIDMSTIGPTSAQEIAQDLKTMGLDFVDAPVTGSTNRAESGELTIFVGGNLKVVEEVTPILKTMGTDVIYMGPNGMGQAIKLVNNLIAGETVATLAEAFLLAERLKLSRKKVADALQNVFAVSPNMKLKMPNMTSNKFPTAFSVANIRKDLHLAQLELDNPSTLPLLKTSEKLYKTGMKKGYGNEDLSAVIKVLEENLIETA
jgi:3-hydroxyisobutyrate dehydrogenase